MVKCSNLSLSQIYQHLKLNFLGEDQCIEGFADLSEEVTHTLKFIQGERLPRHFIDQRDSWVLVSRRFSLKNTIEIICENPYESFVELVEKFAHPEFLEGDSCIDPTARIHSTAWVEGRVDEGVEIGPHCWVEKGAHLKKNASLAANVVVRAGVTIGEKTKILSGTVLGEQGFGFFKSSKEKATRDIPHWAGVVIEEDVVIGPLCTIAAGFLSPTRIGARTRLDAQVLIAHNCSIGKDCILAGQSGMAGSCVVEDGVTLAGGAQLAWKVHVGRGAVLSAKAGVIGDVPARAWWSGFPARPHREWLRGQAWLRKQQDQ